MARWETTTRWYEAAGSQDLFGTGLVLRTWGAKGTRRQGHKADAALDLADAQARIEALHWRRSTRAYVRVE
jgi:hypothetical protein